jgi:hypothetical protein
MVARRSGDKMFWKDATMKRWTLVCLRGLWVAIFICCTGCGAGRCEALGGEALALRVAFGNQGPSSIRLGGTELLAPRPRLSLSVRFRKASDTTELADRAAKAKDIFFPGDVQTASQSFDPRAQKLTVKYAWGEIDITYQVQQGRIDTVTTVTNRSQDILSELNLELFRLRLPADAKPAPVGEAIYFGQTIPVTRQNSLSGPLVLPISAPAYTLVACSPEAVKPLTMALDSTPEKDGACLWTVSIHAGGDQLLYDKVYDTRPVPPGGSDIYPASLCFGPAGDPLAPADDVCLAYARAHPMLLKWPDRRPIGRTFIGDWFPEQPWAVLMGEVPAGPVVVTDAFRRRVVQSADAGIASLKQANAQGMIIWNVEGNKPAWLQYVGDPHMVEMLCPEMNAIADEYFRKFSDAGLRTGVCLRPTVVRKGRDPSSGKPTILQDHDFTRSVVDILGAKIDYAKRRWGCTLFYVDSNMLPKPHGSASQGFSALMCADDWDELCRRHPDVLLLPEHSYMRYYTSSVAYDQMDMWAGITPPLVKRTWPQSFKCLVLDWPSLRQYDKMVQAVRNGDILMANLPLERGGAFVLAAQREAQYLEQGPPQAVAEAGLATLIALAQRRQSDSKTRFFVSQRLARLRDPRALDALIELARDADWLVTKNAVLGLGELGDARACNILIALMADPREGLDPIVLMAFSRLGGPAVAPLAVLAENYDSRGKAALQALGAIRTAEARRALEQIVKNGRAPAAQRCAALQSLSQHSDPSVADVLLEALGDRDLRTLAAQGLAKVKDARVVPALQAARDAEKARQHPDDKFVNVVTAVLARVKGK